MRAALVSVVLVVLAAGSIAHGDEPKRGFEATTVRASLPKTQTTKTIFATVKITGEVGEDE